MSLTAKTVSGFKWITISQVSRQVAQLITTAILARLLNPDDFGLIGMAMVAIGFINIFKDLGTSSAIIQRQDVSDQLLHSIYWVNVIFGLISTMVLFLLSGSIASFYNEPRIEPVLETLSMTFTISGMSIVHQSILEKELAFRKVAKGEIVSTVTGSVVGIALALNGFGVWSLVFQSIAVSAVTTVLLSLASGWRPKAVFVLDEIKRVSSYSMHLTGYSVFNYLVRNSDYLLVGKFLGAQDLGFYTLAYRIMLFPLQNISSVISRVMFPVYSILRDDDETFRQAYLRVTSVIALISFPIMIALWVVADSFVVTIFGNQWIPSVLLIKILIPVGILQSIGTTVGSIYQAKGRTDLMLRWGGVTGLLTVLGFVFGIQWGIVGVAIAYTVTTLILSYPGFLIPFKLIGMTFGKMREVVVMPMVLSAIMAIFMLIVDELYSKSHNGSASMYIVVVVGVVVYGIMNMTLNKVKMQQLWSSVKIK